MFGNNKRPSNILFFDSFCGLCHFAVRFLINHDKKHQLSFAPIGGETFLRCQLEHYAKIDSVIFLDESGNVYLKSQAVLKALEFTNLKFISYLLRFIPNYISDWIYDKVALKRKRYQCELVIINKQILK